MLLLNAAALINHVNRYLIIAFTFRLDLDRAVFRTVFNGILDEVDDRLLEKLRIEVRFQALLTFYLYLNPFFLGLVGAGFERVLQHVPHQNRP